MPEIATELIVANDHAVAVRAFDGIVPAVHPVVFHNHVGARPAELIEGVRVIRVARSVRELRRWYVAVVVAQQDVIHDPSALGLEAVRVRVCVLADLLKEAALYHHIVATDLYGVCAKFVEVNPSRRKASSVNRS